MGRFSLSREDPHGKHWTPPLVPHRDGASAVAAIGRAVGPLVEGKDLVNHGNKHKRDVALDENVLIVPSYAK